MFFVVDVETSGLTPWSGGQLLSFGIQAVNHEGVFVNDPLYVRLKHTAAHPLSLNKQYRTSTENFWAEQDTFVMEEAFANGPRVNRADAMDMIDAYLDKIEPDKGQRFVTANPVAFDKMWLEAMYGRGYDDRWPFHYRCLCLRSMRYGLTADPTYGSAKGAQESKYPHHAMYDAIAEAEDLAYLLIYKRNIGGSLL